MIKLKEYEIEIKEELSKVVNIKADSLLDAIDNLNKDTLVRIFDNTLNS